MNNNLFKEDKHSETIYKTNYYHMLFKRIFTNLSFIIPLIILLSIFIFGLIINYFVTKETYLTININNAFISPNTEYLFGTNEFGQNMFYQVFTGCYTTLKLAFIITFMNLLFGTIIGIIWGNSPKIDSLMIFIKNVFDNIPLIFFFIIIVTALGNGFISILLILTIFGWINIACLIRNNLVILRNKDYNTFAKLNNVSLFKMALNNYLPPLLPIIFNSIAISIPEIISFEITLSYFGFSLGKDNISLGSLLYHSIIKNNCFTSPYLFFIPFFFLLIINLCFYYIGKAIADASIKEEIK